MVSYRIYDLSNNVLALDLKDLLRLLESLSLQAKWKVSTVKSSKPGHEWFEATGDGGVKLEALSEHNVSISGSDLLALADDTRQVIWGEFTASLPTGGNKDWVTIRAVDSTFYEIETDDENVLNKIGAVYSDVRVGEHPVISWPLPK